VGWAGAIYLWRLALTTSSPPSAEHLTRGVCGEMLDAPISGDHQGHCGDGPKEDDQHRLAIGSAGIEVIVD
jgi:hypothetical protein